MYTTTMKPKSLRLLCWAASVTKVLGDSNCSQALSLDVTNVTLSNGQIARGVVMGVGTPSQSLAFLPLMYASLFTRSISTENLSDFHIQAHEQHIRLRYERLL